MNHTKFNIEETPLEFKVPDEYTCYYARYFVHLNPQYRDRFKMRKIRNEKHKAAWWAYHNKNRHIYQRFAKEALKRIESSEKIVSSKRIIYDLRENL